MPRVSKRIERLVAQMESSSEIHFTDLAKVCDHYFGEPRQAGTSHRVYSMPWAGDPRVNIQNEKGRAKRYQIKQVLAAIAKLKEAKQ